MANYPRLSKSDSIIMDIIWEEKEVSSRVILLKAETILGWSRQTVKTYLNRLQEKGMIGVNIISPRVHVYFSLITKEDYATEMASTYLDKYFDDLSHMMAGLIKRENVTDSELDALEAIIKEQRAKNNQE